MMEWICLNENLLANGRPTTEAALATGRLETGSAKEVSSESESTDIVTGRFFPFGVGLSGEESDPPDMGGMTSSGRESAMMLRKDNARLCQSFLNGYRGLPPSMWVLT